MNLASTLLATGLALAASLPAGATWGPKYAVYKATPAGEVQIKAQASVWFNTRADWTREVWQACRGKKLTKRGAALAVAHARLAGGAWLTPGKTRGPLKGYNFWGIRATDKWKKPGKWYYYSSGLDWRYYASPSHGAGGWLYVMRHYPQARAELFKAKPSALTYAHGLFHGTGGRKYKACKGGALGLCGDLLGAQLQTIVEKVVADLQAQGFSL